MQRVDAAHGGIVVFGDVVKAVLFCRSLPKRDQEHFTQVCFHFVTICTATGCLTCGQCFRLFDTDSRGFLSRDDFIRVLTTYGAKMTQEEVRVGDFVSLLAAGRAFLLVVLFCLQH